MSMGAGIRRRWGGLALAVGVTAGLLPLSGVGAAGANSVTVYYQPPAAWNSASVFAKVCVPIGVLTAVPAALLSSHV